MLRYDVGNDVSRGFHWPCMWLCPSVEAHICARHLAATYVCVLQTFTVSTYILSFLQKQLEAGEAEIRKLSADLAAANQLLGNDLAEKNKDLRTKLQEAQLALDTVSCIT